MKFLEVCAVVFATHGDQWLDYDVRKISRIHRHENEFLTGHFSRGFVLESPRDDDNKCRQLACRLAVLTDLSPGRIHSIYWSPPPRRIVLMRGHQSIKAAGD